MQIEPTQPPTRIILEQAGAWGRWGTRIAWTVAGISVLAALASAGAAAQYFQRDAKVVEKYHSLSRMAPSKVAIVDVSGAIMGGQGFARWQLDRIDEEVGEEVVDVAGLGAAEDGEQRVAPPVAADESVGLGLGGEEPLAPQGGEQFDPHAAELGFDPRQRRVGEP